MMEQFPFKEANTQKVLYKAKEQVKVEGKQFSIQLIAVVQECLMVDPSKRISLRSLLEKPFVKDKAAEISEKLAEQNRIETEQSPIDRMRSFAQERTYSAIYSENTPHSAHNQFIQFSNEIGSNSLKMEVITQQYDRSTRKPSVAESFKLGVNVSNFMVTFIHQKRGFYRSTAIGSSRHLGSSFNDQELIFSLSIPGEEGIATTEFNRGMSLGNKFMQKK